MPTKAYWVRAELAVTFFPTHNQTGVSFFDHMNVNIIDLIGRSMPINWRIDNGLIDVGHCFLKEVRPTAGVGLIGSVKIGVRAEYTQQSGHMVGAASDPAITYAMPGGQGISF